MDTHLVCDTQPLWVCGGCGKNLSPHELTRVGIGVHHYDRAKDTDGNGLLNCGLVKEVQRTDCGAPMVGDCRRIK